MPELPEVETVMRGLAPVMEGAGFARVTLNRPDLRVPITPGFAEAMSDGGAVKGLVRRGKYILAFLESGAGFVLHLGMSGRIHIYEAGQAYEPQKHDHVMFEMEGGARIIFNDPRRFGMLYLVHEERWQSESPFAAMGPEPLGNEFNGPVLLARLGKKRVAIKNALLDQKIVVGVGNIYACEALYEARISPMREAGSLSDEEGARLAASIRNVLRRAIEAGGSTLKDYQHTDGSLGYFQHSFIVYDREGARCPACCAGGGDGTQGAHEGGDPCVIRIVQSGRSTFYCPVQQI